MMSLKIDDSYVGTDVDLEISLHEYGLAVKEEEDGYHIVYGVEVGEADTGEPIHIGFDHCTLTGIEIVELLDLFDDEDLNSLNSSCDTSYTKGQELEDIYDVVRLLSDILGWWGAENFFSPGYYNFKVEIN